MASGHSVVSTCSVKFSGVSWPVKPTWRTSPSSLALSMPSTMPPARVTSAHCSGVETSQAW